MTKHAHGTGKKLYVTVWACLLVLTVLEVFLAYRHFPLHVMLVILMGLSIVKAALIISYFMHLRFEKMSLFLTLFPALIFCIALLFLFFPDSIRLHELRVY